MTALASEVTRELRSALAGAVRTDLTTRLLYSTDASIYQIEPLGVAFPETADELAAAVEICARRRVPLLARGSGSSLAGQAIGPALILDLSRRLNRILEIDPEASTAIVEPGVILTTLNRAAGVHGLQFGPDPASAERATIGGSLANNASGAHSILYGMAADHLLSAEVILADGTSAVFEPVSLEEAARRARNRNGEAGDREEGLSIEAGLYAAALGIRDRYGEAIRTGWPKTWRRASGYGLNYLLPWSPSGPPRWDEAGGGDLPYPPARPGFLNLAPLLAGSEGTLAVIRKATLRLVPLPRATLLALLPFPSLAAACEAVPAILETGPSAVELIPQELVHLARSVPAYAPQTVFLGSLLDEHGKRGALLAVEYASAGIAAVREKVGILMERRKGMGTEPLILESAEAQQRVWAVRKAGLGILMSHPGDLKPLAFIEDLAVPVERLGEFVREMDRLLAEHRTRAAMYAHASAGCLHIRPVINLKTAAGVKALREIADQAVDLTLRLGGSVSGEHGDGLARSEWLERMFGSEIVAAFRELKRAADPQGLLNPGKIIDPDLMDAHLRFGPAYRTMGWPTTLDFGRNAGLAGAIEQCNGAGVCRKVEGTMCPSFQALQDEMHSTRGRANLLRALISGRFPNRELGERAVYEALDLCLACKGCKAECPSAVDMAKLKYEFSDHYYRSHRRKLRDYLFGYIGLLARLGSGFRPLANAVLASAWGMQLGERLLGLARGRALPKFAAETFSQRFEKSLTRRERRQLLHGRKMRHGDTESPEKGGERVFLLNDAFTEYFYPEAGSAAARALQAAGCVVTLLPVLGAGRTLISKGFLEAARSHARQLMTALDRLDPEGTIPIVGVEPSEIYTLRDEYLDLLPGDVRAQAAAKRAYMVDEFLVRPGREGEARVLRIVEKHSIGEPKGPSRPVLLHGHCYQKAQPPAADGYPAGVQATARMLELSGFAVKVIPTGCCGMAGAFGYEAEHYELSMQVGELALLPAVRAAGEDVIIAASGVSCQGQIEDGTGRKAVHPITLIL